MRARMENTLTPVEGSLLQVRTGVCSKLEHLTHPTTIQYPRRSQTYYHTTSVTD